MNAQSHAASASTSLTATPAAPCAPGRIGRTLDLALELGLLLPRPSAAC